MPREYESDPEYEEEQQEEQEEEQEEVEEQAEEQDEEEQESGWAWSTCQGNKKALFIGINYAGSAAPLNGCHNDVHNLHAFINEHWGYEDAEKMILLDDNEDSATQPTRDNILAAFNWLVEGASENDALFLHYSGHGGTKLDTDGDEHDGHDETLCPVDYETAGDITDDEVHDYVVKPLPKGCRLTVVFDCCHSGTLLDLPYTYGADGEIQTSASKHRLELAQEAVRADAEGDADATARALQHLSVVEGVDTEAAHRKTQATRSSHADVIYLSGCQDVQTSADATENGAATGALSHMLVNSLTENPEQSYHDLLVDIRARLVEKSYSQIPQLASSHPIDVSLNFII